MSENIRKLRHLGESMKSPEDVKEFDRILGLYYDGERDPETLKNLLTVFSDKCQYPEVMYGLVHLVETWPKEVYVKMVLESLEELSHRSVSWTDVLFSGIFNSKEYLSEMENNLKLAGSGALDTLLSVMEKGPAPHKLVVADLKTRKKSIFT